MSEVLAPEVSQEQLSQWLELARAAQKQGHLDEGLGLAGRVWTAASQHGFLNEQIEAGRLKSYFLFRSGDLSAMLSTSATVLPLLREQGASIELCELLRWTALAASEQGDFETALSAANEGFARAQELGDVGIKAVALNALGACFERMGDPWQAERLMNDAAVLVRDCATPYERVVTLNNLCTVALGAYLMTRDAGQTQVAQDALQRALHYGREVRPHARELGEPYALALTESNLGEVLMLLGELDDAAALLASALAQSQSQGYQTLSWRVQCSQAELNLLQGRAGHALISVQALERAAGTAMPGFVRQRLHQTGYRAAKQVGEIAVALRHLEAFQSLAHQRSVAQLMAQSRFFVTRLEAEQVRALADQAFRQIDALSERAQELEQHAQRDPLTGLGNRRYMEARLPALMLDCEQRNRALTVALIDADRFKSINDHYGHVVGDRVLQALARMLQENTRASDLLLRYGGEEFLIVFPDTVPDRAFEVCERVRMAVERFAWNDLATGLDVTLSIGLASAAPYSTDLLIARADSAMYRAKHLGRNRVALA
ncbi:GGDEF domain-containing protein [Paucibacter sp. APW11]|uniref:diguanylate cyclase n=1 Tax=Roseateles aquae TaxID=3077235 RepID=A0ABU3PHM0_9BURK|nr:GGDEF domain-containing protein [Paucibacter sp. APW11]MDT9001925.1 GGDEF domain-containing protein [Paucibacter sp. APW11]